MTDHTPHEGRCTACPDGQGEVARAVDECAKCGANLSESELPDYCDECGWPAGAVYFGDTKEDR